LYFPSCICLIIPSLPILTFHFTLFHLRPSNTKSWFLLYVISIVCSSDLLCMCHFSRLMMSLFSCYFCPLGEARHHLNNIPSQSSARPQRPHSRLTIGTNGSHITITLCPPQSIQRILCRPGLPPTHDSNEHYHGCHFICMAQPPGIIIDLFNNVLLLSAKHVPTSAYVKPSSSDSNACMRTPPLRLLHFLLFYATFDTCFNDSTPLCHFNVIVLVLVSLQAPGTGGFASSEPAVSAVISLLLIIPVLYSH